MSKLIVEMEMPVCCADCPCCICLNGMKPAYCKAVMVDDDNIVDGLMWRETDPNNRPSWCPIIGELPEQHGRLIDSDAFISTIRPLCEEDKFAACTFETVKRLMVEHINNAPTIVPADTAERSEYDN